MNLILLEPAELRDGPRVILRGRRAVHILTVLKPALGQALAVGELDGRMGKGIVVALEADAVTLELTLDTEPPAPLGIALLLALPRPKILRKVLQSAASLGIKRLTLLGSHRVEKSYFTSPVLEPAALRGELLLGLEQGRDTRVPEVSLHRYFKPFVEDRLEALYPDHARLLPHPFAEATLVLPEPRPARAVLAIGPEGGWTAYEAEQLQARGFQPFHIGPRILRVDVAVPFLVGQLAFQLSP